MIEKVIFDNGVTVVMEKMPFVRSVAFGIFVKSGSCNEDKTTNGISHFIEHMMFKGTENRSAKDIANEMDSIGGQINAYTAKEYTCYYTRTLDTHFDKSLDILSDMYFNSKFDDEEIKKERNVVIEEISMYEDTPEDLVYDKLQSSIWRNNSIGFSILGTSDVISKFNHDTFIEYRKKHYRPDNTVISVAGNFKKDEILKKIENYFGSWKSNEEYKENEKEVEYFPSKIKIEKDIEQIHLVISFKGIPYGSDDSYTMTALNTILGGGMSSKLFQKIREENGLVYSIYSFGSAFVNSGLFNIYAGLSPNNYDQVYKLILEEVEKLRNNSITEQQLLKTKEQIKSNFILALENSGNRMSSMGRNQLLLNKIKTTDEIIKKIDDITPQKILDISKQIFNIDNLSVSVVGKVGGIIF